MIKCKFKVEATDECLNEMSPAYKCKCPIPNLPNICMFSGRHDCDDCKNYNDGFRNVICNDCGSKYYDDPSRWEPK